MKDTKISCIQSILVNFEIKGDEKEPLLGNKHKNPMCCCKIDLEDLALRQT